MLTKLCACLAVLLAFAPSAGARLVYQRTGKKEIVAAKDDGSQAHVIAAGIDPIVSPNGKWVAFASPRSVYADLKLVSVQTGATRLLRHNFPACACGPLSAGLRPVWSANSRYLVAVDASNGIGHLFDIANRSQHELTAGYGSSGFAPDSDRIAVSYVDNPHQPNRLAVYNVERRTSKGIGAGDMPAWGAAGLAFTRPKGLVLEAQPGGSARVLVPWDGRGFLYGVDWSEGGGRLLAARGTHEFSLKALLIAPGSGHVVTLAATFSEVDALSRHGRWVLGATGGDVVAMRAGGETRVLARNASSASWTK